MATAKEYLDGCSSFFKGVYSVTKTFSVPDVGDLAFAKEGKEIELAMLFIDIGQSTKIVDSSRRITAAKMYKSFLWGITKIAREFDGDVRSFNGDGILVAFAGESKRTNAVKAAMHMVWYMRNVLKPKMESYFNDNQALQGFLFDFGIGIDVGPVLVVRGGIRGDNNNDLVWVGNATNYSVKLAALCAEGYHIFISKDIYDKMEANNKTSDGQSMWEQMVWTGFDGRIVYRSNYHWGF